jgi:hypothetical protein
MLNLLVYLAVFVCLAVLIWWILQQVTLPEPLNKIIMIVFVVIGAIALISILLSATGTGGGLHLPKFN